MKQLPTPEPATDDPDSSEMMRVWIAQKRLYISLNVGVYYGKTDFNEEKAWGIILADAARHISAALEQRFGVPRTETLEGIVSSFSSELSAPSSATSGDYVKKH